MDRLGHKFCISLFVTLLCLYLFDMDTASTIVTFVTTFLTV